MKRNHSLTRIAASLLLLPLLHLAVTGLFYGLFLLDDIRWPDFLSNTLYAIFVFMGLAIPHVTVGTSIVGIILQTGGIRKGESKRTGIWVICGFALWITLLIAACIALVWSLPSEGIGS